MEIQINEVTCLRCGHKWPPRKSDVRICPKCKSAWWDQEKKEAIADLKKDYGDD